MTKTDPTTNIVLKALENLPSEDTIDEAMERLLFLSKIEKGVKDLEQGNIHTHEEIEQMLKEWSK